MEEKPRKGNGEDRKEPEEKKDGPSVVSIVAVEGLGIKENIK